jgi:acetylornithine deacetylase/succinyl-diaminopimelate desuccinylase-like protein
VPEVIKEYQQYLEQLVAIPSISTDSKYASELDCAVKFFVDLFQHNNFVTETYSGPDSNPVVFAQYIQDPQLKTILIYGHYDVQPAEMSQGWVDNPFILRKEENKFVARGVVDNKGQILIHIVSVLQHIRDNTLGYNVKFLIEGNEETGNPDLGNLIAKHKEQLQCDTVLISDGEILADYPVIESSLRGGMNVKLNICTAKHDVHSGIYGGAIPNAAQVAANIVTQLYSETGIAFPKFYNDVDETISEQILSEVELFDYTTEILQHISVQKLLTEPGQDFFSQTGLRPTIQITGIKTGYTGEGYANIVPASAEIRFNFRIVASQKIENVLRDFKDFLQQIIPDYAQYELSVSGMHEPIKIDITSDMHQKAAKILSTVYGKQPLIKHVGGAIPFVADVTNILGANVLLIPFANDDCNMHGPEENFKVDNISKALEFSSKFFKVA